MKSLYKSMGGAYPQKGDYLAPDPLPEGGDTPLGKLNGSSAARISESAS